MKGGSYGVKGSLASSGRGRRENLKVPQEVTIGILTLEKMNIRDAIVRRGTYSLLFWRYASARDFRKALFSSGVEFHSSIQRCTSRLEGCKTARPSPNFDKGRIVDATVSRTDELLGSALNRFDSLGGRLRMN